MPNIFTGDETIVARWRFENSLKDETPNGYVLIPSSTVNYSGAIVKEGSTSLQLSGSDYVYLNNVDLNSSFPLYDGSSTNQFTIVFWHYRPTGNGYSPDIVWGEYSVGNYGFGIIYRYDTSFWRLIWPYNNGNNVEILSWGMTTSYQINGWIFNAILVDIPNKQVRKLASRPNSTIWNYDGILYPTNTFGSTSTPKFTIGAYPGYGSANGIRYYDNVILYNRILSEAELFLLNKDSYIYRNQSARVNHLTKGVIYHPGPKDLGEHVQLNSIFAQAEYVPGTPRIACSQMMLQIEYTEGASFHRMWPIPLENHTEVDGGWYSKTNKRGHPVRV